jgi:hypothetical protein
MIPQCSNCFFSRMNGSQRECHYHSPVAGLGNSVRTVAWPEVSDTDWCGDGWDGTNLSYTSPVTVQQRQMPVTGRKT